MKWNTIEKVVEHVLPKHILISKGGAIHDNVSVNEKVNVQISEDNKSSSEDKEKQIEKIARDTVDTMKIMSELEGDATAMRVLTMFKDGPPDLKNFSSEQNAAITRLMNFGLLEYDSIHGSGLHISNNGIQIQNILHEIEPWLY